MKEPIGSSYVLVIGDWDADGVVASALIKYSQEYLGIYPFNMKIKVLALPATPRSLKSILEGVRECPRALVVLDLPYVKGIEKTLKNFKNVCKEVKIIYVDHHISTFNNVKKLEYCVDSLLINPSPTTRIIYEKIKSFNGKISKRLEAFVKVTTLMDEGVKIPKSLERISKLLIEISKALAVAKDKSLWIEIMEWLSESSLIPHKSVNQILSKISSLATELDKHISEVATEIAMQAKKVGYLKYIDLTKKNIKFSSTVLASKIYSILRSTLALKVSRKNYDLLIIKGKKGIPYKIAKYLHDLGLTEDVGGHESLVIIKLKKNIPNEVLELSLREASIKWFGSGLLF